jgi:hypothetical protein
VRPRKDHRGVDLIFVRCRLPAVVSRAKRSQHRNRLAKKRSNQMAATDQCTDHQSNLARISRRYSL